MVLGEKIIPHFVSCSSDDLSLVFFFFLFLSGLFGSVSKKSSAPTTSGGATTINDGVQQALRGWY